LLVLFLLTAALVRFRVSKPTENGFFLSKPKNRFLIKKVYNLLAKLKGFMVYSQILGSNLADFLLISQNFPSSQIRQAPMSDI
jgi:hypothetical protein